MDLFKDITQIIYNNYYIYFFVLFFEYACILFEKVVFKGAFTHKDRFDYYFMSILINFAFGNALVNVYSALFLDKKNHNLFMIFFIAISFVAGIIISLILKRIVIALRKKSLRIIFKDNIYGFAIFGIFIIKYILCVPTIVDTWHAWCYSIDWSMGLSSRFLAGQVLSTFCRNFVSDKSIFLFCFFVGLLLIIIVTALINTLIKKTGKKTKPAVIFICGCFVSCPVSINSLFTETNFGKLEIFGLTLSLISVVVFNKIKNIPLKYFAVTILSILGIMFYQGYVFLYYNIILIIMIYDTIDENQIKKKNAFYGSASICVSFLVFLKFQLFNQIGFQTSEQMIERLNKRTNIEIWKKPIELEYFSDLKESYKLVVNYIDDFAREYFLFQIILMIPLIYLLTFIIYNCFSIEKKKECTFNLLKLRNTLCLMSLLLIIPQFLLNVDWGRWLIAIFIFIFFYILYFLYQRDYSMQLVFEDLSAKITKRPFWYALLWALLSTFNCVQEMSFPDAQRIVSFIVKIIN